MAFRKYLAISIFLGLLIWGPIDHSRPAWFMIRISYLILIPLSSWLFISLIWKYWRPNNNQETKIEQIFCGVICTVLLLFAISEATSKTHLGNSEWIQTPDGREAVGDNIILQGPDWFKVLILSIIALFIFWFGVLKKSFNKSH